MLEPRQAIARLVRRLSSGWRVDPDASWIVIRKPGVEPLYFDIPSDQVTAVTAEFEAIGDSPERFKAFASTIESVVSSRN